MLAQVEKDFPALVQLGYVKTSNETPAYNCIAFTMGDQSRPWWPPIHPGMQAHDSFWPPSAPCQATVDAFVAMYRQQGFEPCAISRPEPGVIKVALFVEPMEDLVEHAALQLPTGRWLSKMGFHEDIAHTLEGLEGPPHYFKMARLLQCPVDRLPPALNEMLLRYGLALV